MKLTEFCIHRPAFTVVLSLLLIALGILGYQNLSLRYLPKIVMPVVSISTDYPGASNDIVENQITTPLEGSLTSIPDLDYMISQSKDGNSTITLNFKAGTDLNVAVEDVRAAVSTTINLMPSDAKTPIVTKMDPNAAAITVFAYSNEHQSIAALTNYVKTFIQPQFEALPQVGKVLLWSSQFYAMRVWLDPAKMAARDVTVSDVEALLSSQNIDVASGYLQNDHIYYATVTDLKLKNTQEFGNLVIKNFNNQIVRLKDIAHIAVGTEHRTSDSIMRFFHVNGKPGVAIGIVPSADANNLAVSDNAVKLFHAMSSKLPSGMQQIIEFNQSDFTHAAIHSVYEALFEAIILVLLVIFAFLGSLRSALIPIVTIPICIIASFACIYFLGYSINSITLLALALAIGLVVDDSIVVLENITRHIEKGKDSLEATLLGSKQIGFAIIAMTLTLAAVYLPTGFMPGIVGIFFREFAFTLLSAVLISGFVALTLSPMMCRYLLQDRIHENSYQRWLENIFNKLKNNYAHLLSLSFKNKIWLLPSLIIIFALGILLFKMLPSELAPEMDFPIINIHAKTPNQDSYHYIESFSPTISNVLKNESDISAYLSQVWQLGDLYTVVALKPISERKLNSHELASQLQEKLNNIPGINVSVTAAPPPLLWNIQNSSAGDVSVNILTTDDYTKLHQTIEHVVQILKETPALRNVDNTLKWDSRQLRIHINRNLAADLEIPMGNITQTLATALGGTAIGKYDFGTQSYDVIMQLPESLLTNQGIINQLYVKSLRNKSIPLASLVSIESRSAPLILTHYNRLRSDTITANLASGYSMSNAVQDVQTVLQNNLSSNSSYAFTGATRQFLDSNNSMSLIFIMAIIFIYLILTAQFESFIDPFIILLTVPLAIVGALATLKITGNTLNIYSEIGLVTLVGLIAKHGILITEFANKLLAEGVSLQQAALESAQQRIRPILMTTAAMILGVLPLALAYGPGSENRQQIGWVLVGGLFIGTFFSLIVVPLAYIIIKKIKYNN